MTEAKENKNFLEEELEEVTGGDGKTNLPVCYRYKCTRPSCGYAAMYEIKHNQVCPACGQWTFVPMDKFSV